MALYPFVGLWPLFQFLNLFTQSVGLLGRGISPSQGRYLHTGQHKHRINAHRHPCLKWDSNPRFQCFSWRRQGPIAVAARSKVWDVFVRSNTGIVGSISTRGKDMSAFILCLRCPVYVAALRWVDLPSKESYCVLLTVYKIKNLKEPARAQLLFIIIIGGAVLSP
jgi:hypothetical protein